MVEFLLMRASQYNPKLTNTDLFGVIKFIDVALGHIYHGHRTFYGRRRRLYFKQHSR